MFRINHTAAIAALLLLRASSSFAAEGDHPTIFPSTTASIGMHTTDTEVYQTATKTIQDEGDQLAHSDADLQQQGAQSEPALNAVTTEYPALALLAMAIISMAALSRRDSFRIDR
jgi:hypothetical protein